MIYFFLLSVFVATLGGERGAGLGVECSFELCWYWYWYWYWNCN